MTNKNLTIGLVVVAIVAIIGVFTPQGKQFLGAVSGYTNYGDLGVKSIKIGTGCDDSFTVGNCVTSSSGISITSTGSTTVNSLKIGAAGTRMTQVLNGTCALTNANTAIAATSSAVLTCSAPGVVAGDRVFITLASTTKVATGQWLLAGASAAATADQIDVTITNLIGVSASPASSGNAAGGFASSTQYMVIR